MTKKRNVLGATLETSKKTNELGKKTNVKRTLTDKAGNVKTTVSKTKTGTGVNRTVTKNVQRTPGKAQTFSQAFAAARKAGKKEFTYKGKRYHTRTKEEEEARKKKLNQTKTKEQPRVKRTMGGAIDTKTKKPTGFMPGKI